MNADLINILYTWIVFQEYIVFTEWLVLKE